MSVRGDIRIGRRACSGGSRGQVLLEFAVLLPVLLLLIIGIFEFGRAWMTASTVGQAAREGARLAVILPDLAENDHRVAARIEEVLTAGNLIATSVTTTVPLEFRGPVVVTVTTEYEPTVLAFLPGRDRAVCEFLRVTKPAGYVGASEATWVKEPSRELREQASQSLGGNLDAMMPQEWQELLTNCGLKDVVAPVQHTILVIMGGAVQ